MTRLLLAAPLALAAALCLGACPEAAENDPAEADAAHPDALVLTDDAALDRPDVPQQGDGDAGVPGDAGAPGEEDAAGGGTVPLALQGISPARGPISGKVAIALSGSGFFKSFASSARTAREETSLLVGGRAAEDLSVINDLRIEATLPPAPEGQVGAVDVVLTNPAGAVRCEGCFTYYAPLALEAIDPARGSTSGGTWVDLRGAGFGSALSVLFGDRPAPQVEVAGDGRARAMTPRADAAGPVLVQAFNENGLAEQIGGFTYEAPLALEAIDPRAVPLAGGAEVALSGRALDRVARLSVDGQEVAFFLQSPAALRFVAPPRPAPGSAALIAETADGLSAELDGGLLYWDPDFDPGAAAGAAFQISGIWPTHGPAQGGNAVHAAGAALDRIAAISIDGMALDKTAWSLAADGRAIEMVMPPGQANRRVALTFQDAAGSAIAVERAYRYDVRLDGVRPERGTCAGGEWVTLSGQGFAGQAPLAVRFGAAVVSGAGDLKPQGDGALEVRTPAAMGTVDVEVFELGDPTNASARDAAFTFEAPLALAAVSPASGTVAGGDEVALYGTGFAPGMGIRFGSSSLRDVTVWSPNRLTGRAPAGSPGAVDVTVQLGEASATLAGGYAYRETAANLGGSSGPALGGTLHVTAFLSSTARIAGVRVSASADGGKTALARGETDAAGQLALQSPGFDRPLRVTFEKEGFQTLVVEGQRAQNLSVFMSPTRASAMPGGGGSTPSGSSEADPSAIPSGSTAAGGSTISPNYPSSGLTPVISGTVTGFKLPRALGPSEIAMAEVWTVPTSYYSTPPFGSAATPALRDARGERWRVTSDGGPFTIYGAQGRQSLYALFGIYDTASQVLTPYLMGLLRGVAVSPATPAANLDIRLDMHLDASLPVTVLPAPSALDPSGPSGGGEEGRGLTHSAFGWLALGNDGYLAFGPATGPGPTLELTGLPRLDAHNFLFLNRSLSADGKFSSFCFQRTSGELGLGLALGPMIGRPIPIAADPGGASAEAAGEEAGMPGDAPAIEILPFDGTIRWRFEGGSAPDLLRLYISIARGDGAGETLEAILPGEATAFALPAALAQAIDPASDSVAVSFQGARAPRFDHDFWSYSHFGTASATCWMSGSFEVPLRRESAPSADGPAGE